MATIVTPPTGSDGKRDYRYSTSGVDLTAPLQLNLNPFDIESLGGRNKAYTQEKWSAFLRFAKSKIDKNDTSLNSQAVWESLTVDLIREFNTSQDSNWVQFGGSSPNRGLQNPLTREDIYAIQRFTKKADPNVQIDGWLGTQTLRMEYPKIETFIFIKKDSNGNVENDAPELLIPVIWGNKRYIISNGEYGKWEKEDKSTRKSLLEIITLYDPAKHPTNKFLRDPNINRQWASLAENISITQSAEQINAETTKKASEKKVLQTQTKIKGALSK